MSTTMEILAATERRLNNSTDTPAELREKLAQSERECIDLLAKSQKAAAVAVALQWDLDAAIRERDAARQARARLVQLWNERGISVRSWHAAERTWKP